MRTHQARGRGRQAGRARQASGEKGSGMSDNGKWLGGLGKELRPWMA